MIRLNGDLSAAWFLFCLCDSWSYRRCDHVIFQRTKEANHSRTNAKISVFTVWGWRDWIVFLVSTSEGWNELAIIILAQKEAPWKCGLEIKTKNVGRTLISQLTVNKGRCDPFSRRRARLYAPSRQREQGEESLQSSIDDWIKLAFKCMKPAELLWSNKASVDPHIHNVWSFHNKGSLSGLRTYEPSWINMEHQRYHEEQGSVPSPHSTQPMYEAGWIIMDHKRYHFSQRYWFPQWADFETKCIDPLLEAFKLPRS